MPISEQAKPVLDKLWILVLAVVLPVWLALRRGIDTNWDTRNYHLYNPHAWLSERVADVAPAQLQTWHNPLLDLPFYLLTVSGVDPRWSSLWLTLPTIATIYFLLRMQPLLSATPPTRVAQAVLAVLALTGAASHATIGTSMNDAFVGAGILCSLWLVLGVQDETETRWRWLLAGLVAGLTCGLKLSASFYCIALAVCALAGGDVWQKIRQLFFLAVGGVAGFALSYGWWGWRMWSLHRNPFFPYYNHIFKSPDAQIEAFADARFRPESLLDALLVPFRLLERSTRYSELHVADPRLLIGIVSLIGAMLLLHRLRAQDSSLRVRLRIFAVFFFSALALWLAQYGIYRYAIVLELLGCLALVALLGNLPRARNIALLLAALLVSADTKRPDWGRIKPGSPRAGIHAAPIPSDSLVLIASGEPLAYAALGLPRETPLVALVNNMMRPGLCTGMQARAEKILANHTGPIWLLEGPDDPPGRAQATLLKSYGLESTGQCLPLISDINKATLCRQRLATVMPPMPTCASASKPGEP